ncbi:DUF805 domain-containing protein [Chelativorans sp. M5D2P16]|uniref:DUF805 domain-containing protein n=1 Tax=Chelativorans sp. M5D2P16 TaxID=3095678 RepID=UPI002AC9F649|nr:DUF805 domain-containing protein [Chelativorans sp. M5D2P16]MDZ5698726.1 DUF805 domain-containing protein [Chelativorans sp. M5D2P16]
MNPIPLLTTFEGRISRSKLWLGVLYLMILSAVFYAILYPFFGTDVFTSPYSDGLTARALASLIATALFAWPSTAIAVKRLRDRNRPLWFVAFFWAPTVIMILAQLTGVGYERVQAQGEVYMVPDTLGMTVSFLSLPVALWAIVELGFLKGTAGPNPHGPDPLAAKA